MLIKILLAFISVCAGAGIASGFIALISMIGVYPRLAGLSKTSKFLIMYENFIVLGVFVGTIMSTIGVNIRIGNVGVIIYSIFSGIFIGCLVGALAEVLNTIPILARRTNIRTGMYFIIIAIALGKGLGTFFQYFIMHQSV